MGNALVCPIYKWSRDGKVTSYGTATIKKQTPLCLHSRLPEDSVSEATLHLPNF